MTDQELTELTQTASVHAHELLLEAIALPAGSERRDRIYSLLTIPNTSYALAVALAALDHLITAITDPD